MKGEMEPKVIYWKPLQGPWLGVGEELATPGPLPSLQDGLEEGTTVRPSALFTHPYGVPPTPSTFDRNMYCEEWGWGGGQSVP